MPRSELIQTDYCIIFQIFCDLANQDILCFNIINVRFTINVKITEKITQNEFPRGGSNSRPSHLLLAYKYDALTNWATGELMNAIL